ncbi:MAG: sulfatase [Planctomycetota bacterium]
MTNERTMTNARILALRHPLLPWLLGSLAALAAPPACGPPPAPPPPLLLLVSVDTLRADHLGAYGSERGLTPSLDALAAESLVFATAYAPSSFTVPSVSALLTGWYPEQNGILSNEHILPASVPTLARMLAARGYRTGAVVSNFVLRRGGGLQGGFERYDDELPELEAVRGIPERLAGDTTDRALTLLDELVAAGDGRAFLWVHYQDPHGPYTPPAADRELYLEAERSRPDGGRRLTFGADHRGLGDLPNYQRIGAEDEVAFYRAGYAAEVARSDREIGRLLAGLRDRGLADRAVVVFAADHGEGLGERDYWFAHGEHLSDPLVRVPLFLRVPGLPPGRRADVAGLTDVVPTLAGIFGLATPAGLPGRDLLAAGAAAAAPELYLATLRGAKLPRIALVRDGYKYVATRTGASRFGEELFRLGEEDCDLAAAEPERLAALRRRIQEVQRDVQSAGRERQRDLSAAEIERLEKIGYAGGDR